MTAIGYRVKLNFVKSIREPIVSQDEIGPVFRSNETSVLNRLEMTEDNIKRVQEGFRQVFQEERGTASGTFANKPYDAASKTGTAQDTYYTEDGGRP